MFLFDEKQNFRMPYKFCRRNLQVKNIGGSAFAVRYGGWDTAYHAVTVKAFSKH